MKKIFRLASVLALAGVALMYTGCTKDYDADIKAIKTDLADLQSGTITNQSQQIAALQAQAASLQTIAGQFQQTLDGLQAAKADKTAVAADKAELLKKISEMEVSISKQISEINAAIADINEIIATKADKSWVEQTFATKTALATVESTLGSVEGRVSAIEGKLANLGVDLDEVEKTLDKVSLTATKAAADATAALGEIDAVKQSLENYYKKGEVVALIEEAKTELQGQIEALDKSKESKEDAAKTRSELLAKIKTLQSNHQSLMKFTNSLSDSVDVRFDRVNLELTALAAKIAGVEKAYKEADEALEKAYKNADEEINKEIEKLQNARKAEIAAREKALEEEIEARKNAIDEEAAQRAGADSTEVAERKAAILQEIADREQAVSDAIKYLNDSIDQEIADRKAAIETEAKARREAIQAVQDSLDNACEMIKANKLSIDQEIANREQAIIDLNNKLTAYSDSLKNHVETEILGLSKRIKSVSVYPTTAPELYRYSVGSGADKDSSLVLVTTFQVRPASAVATITADQLKLNYGYALQRGNKPTRAEAIMSSDVTIDSVNSTLGLIRVRAAKLAENGTDIFNSSERNQFFFALEITESDTVGSYTILSEYQNPVYGKSLNLNNQFSASNKLNVDNKRFLISEEIPYPSLDTTEVTAYPLAAIYVYFNKPEGNVFATIPEFEAYTGMKLEVSDSVVIRTKHSTQAPDDSCAVLKPNAKSGLDTKVEFENTSADSTSFKLFIGEIDTIVYHPIINGADVDVDFRHIITIIKNIKASVSKEFRIYWNYKNYAEGKSYDSVMVDTAIKADPTTADFGKWWSYGVNKNFEYLGNDFLLFKKAGVTMNNNRFRLKVFGNSPYYNSFLTAIYGSYAKSLQLYSDTLKKETVSDRLNYYISVKIDSLPVVKSETFTLNNVKFTFTKDNKIVFDTAQVTSRFIGSQNAPKDYLIAGLNDYDFDEIKDIFFATEFSVDSVLYRNSTNDKLVKMTINPGDFSMDSTTVIVKAGILKQNAQYKVFAHKDLFVNQGTGSKVTYPAQFNFSTSDALLKLDYDKLITTGAKTRAFLDNSAANYDSVIASRIKDDQYYGLAYGKDGDTTTYSLKDMYVVNYLHVVAEANTLTELYNTDQFIVDYKVTPENSVYGCPGKPYTSTIAEDALTGRINLISLANAEDQAFSFEGYKGRSFDVEATLYFKNGNDKVKLDSKKFTIWTQVPVKLDVPAQIKDLKTVAGQPLTVKVQNSVKIHNNVNGVYQTSSIYNTQKMAYYFPQDKGVTYKFLSAVCNGSEQILTDGKHYSLNTDDGTFVLFQDNVKGNWEIKIGVEMTYWLDYNETKFVTNQAGVQYAETVLLINNEL